MTICPVQASQSYADPVHKPLDVSSDCRCTSCIANCEISARSKLQADRKAAFLVRECHASVLMF